MPWPRILDFGRALPTFRWIINHYRIVCSAVGAAVASAFIVFGGAADLGSLFGKQESVAAAASVPAAPTTQAAPSEADQRWRNCQPLTEKERDRILKLIEAGKVTATEGAELARSMGCVYYQRAMASNHGMSSARASLFADEIVMSVSDLSMGTSFDRLDLVAFIRTGREERSRTNYTAYIQTPKASEAELAGEFAWDRLLKAKGALLGDAVQACNPTGNGADCGGRSPYQ